MEGKELNPIRYGVVQSGVSASPVGQLLYLKDVIKALDLIMDDDEQSVDRLMEFHANLAYRK